VNQKETGSVGGSAETGRVLCIDDNVHGISVSSPTEFAQPIFAPDAASLIAKATGVSHPTVAKVRVDLEDGGKIYHHELSKISCTRAAPATVHKKRRRPAAPPWLSRAVYDGRDFVAVVRPVGNKFEVRGKRKMIGRFATLKLAMVAVGKIRAQGPR
jgi:hypothetical protein